MQPHSARQPKLRWLKQSRRTDNAFKVELAKRCLVRTLKTGNGLAA